MPTRKRQRTPSVPKGPPAKTQRTTNDELDIVAEQIYGTGTSTSTSTSSCSSDSGGGGGGGGGGRLLAAASVQPPLPPSSVCAASRRLAAGRVPREISRIQYSELAPAGATAAEHRAAFARRYASGGSSATPVVICGAPGVPKDWTPDQLVARAGGLEIPVSLVNEELGGARTQKRLMRLGEYVALLRGQLEATRERDQRQRRRRPTSAGGGRGGAAPQLIGGFTPYAKQMADLFEALPAIKAELDFALFDRALCSQSGAAQ